MTVKIGNPEALITAIKFIENEPHRWDQGTYASGPEVSLPRASLANRTLLVVDQEACGSTMCLAGTLVYQAGYFSDGLDAWTDTGEYAGQVHNIAAEILGADQGMADELFLGVSGGGEDSLSSFKERVSEITGVQFDD
jgi:hypothetical protein